MDHNIPVPWVPNKNASFKKKACLLFFQLFTRNEWPHLQWNHLALPGLWFGPDSSLENNCAQRYFSWLIQTKSTKKKNKFNPFRKKVVQKIRKAVSYDKPNSEIELDFGFNWKEDKTARIKARPWMFRLPLKVYRTVITWKKLNVIKKWNFFNMRFFCPPTRHKKHKVKDLAPSKKSIMASKLSSTNLERFLRSIKSPLNR